MAVSHDVYALFASLIRDRLAVFGVAPFDVDASRARTSANAHELQCSTSQTMSTIADAYAAMMSVFETTLGEDDNDCFVLRFLAVNAERAGSDRTLVDEFAIFRRDEVEIDADADPAIDARAVFASKQATQAVLFAPLLISVVCADPQRARQLAQHCPQQLHAYGRRYALFAIHINDGKRTTFVELDEATALSLPVALDTEHVVQPIPGVYKCIERDDRAHDGRVHRVDTDSLRTLLTQRAQSPRSAPVHRFIFIVEPLPDTHLSTTAPSPTKIALFGAKRVAPPKQETSTKPADIDLTGEDDAADEKQKKITFCIFHWLSPSINDCEVDFVQRAARHGNPLHGSLLYVLVAMFFWRANSWAANAPDLRVTSFWLERDTVRPELPAPKLEMKTYVRSSTSGMPYVEPHVEIVVRGMNGAYGIAAGIDRMFAVWNNPDGPGLHWVAVVVDLVPIDATASPAHLQRHVRRITVIDSLAMMTTTSDSVLTVVSEAIGNLSVLLHPADLNCTSFFLDGDELRRSPALASDEPVVLHNGAARVQDDGTECGIWTAVVSYIVANRLADDHTGLCDGADVWRMLRDFAPAVARVPDAPQPTSHLRRALIGDGKRESFNEPRALECLLAPDEAPLFATTNNNNCCFIVATLQFVVLDLLTHADEVSASLHFDVRGLIAEYQTAARSGTAATFTDQHFEWLRYSPLSKLGNLGEANNVLYHWMSSSPTWTLRSNIEIRHDSICSACNGLRSTVTSSLMAIPVCAEATFRGKTLPQLITERVTAGAGTKSWFDVITNGEDEWCQSCHRKCRDYEEELRFYTDVNHTILGGDLLHVEFVAANGTSLTQAPRELPVLTETMRIGDFDYDLTALLVFNGRHFRTVARRQSPWTRASAWYEFESSPPKVHRLRNFSDALNCASSAGFSLCMVKLERRQQ